VWALVLPLASCATVFNGTTQLVPVTSRPERAEVFVGGVSMGFTPVELELPRNGDVTVDVRLGDRVRSFGVHNEVQGAVVLVDLVPVGFAGGLVLLASSLGSTADVASMVGVLALSTVPALVDYGSGALYRLNPREIVAVFD
jgi:hypothetical protein